MDDMQFYFLVSTVFQSYQDDERLIMKVGVQWKLSFDIRGLKVTNERINQSHLSLYTFITPVTPRQPTRLATTNAVEIKR